MRSILRRVLAVVVATGAVALAAPVSGASAQIPDGALPIGGSTWVAVGGNQIGGALCVNTNRPAVGGNNASTSAQTCGGATYQGAQIGSLNTAVGQPTVINSPFTEVNVSAGSLTGVGP